MREHISSTYSSRKNLVLPYALVCMVRTSWRRTYVLAYVARAIWSSTYSFAYMARTSRSSTYLFAYVVGSFRITQYKLKYGSMITSSFGDESSPHSAHLSIAHESPVSTDQQMLYSTRHLLPSSGYYWSFERSIAPSASRRIHIPLCCRMRLMSSAWSFALILL